MPMGEAVLSIPRDPPDRGHAVSTKDILVMSTVLGVPYARDRSCCAADPVRGGIGASMHRFFGRPRVVHANLAVPWPRGEP